MSRYAWLRDLRFWLAALLFVILVRDGLYALDRSFQRSINRVTTRWDGDTLRVFTIHGGPLVVTHLAGTSQSRGVAAVLPEPEFLFDSGGPKFSRSVLEKLAWITEGGERLPPPPIGSRIYALYYRLQRSEWQRFEFDKEQP